ncbi:hypothetical protein ACDF64_06205 [Agromyces sp. MMS24-JH15]|uniref:hypothetical protein n=1 Tax=Agromyces sp. MMS24-JH15 TaxID=3243765 RepID=UPI003749D505
MNRDRLLRATAPRSLAIAGLVVAFVAAVIVFQHGLDVQSSPPNYSWDGLEPPADLQAEMRVYQFAYSFLLPVGAAAAVASGFALFVVGARSAARAWAARAADREAEAAEAAEAEAAEADLAEADPVLTPRRG